MSVESGMTQWIIRCDRKGCTSMFTGLYATCSHALMDARGHGWAVRHDGMARCPGHVGEEA